MSLIRSAEIEIHIVYIIIKPDINCQVFACSHTEAEGYFRFGSVFIDVFLPHY